MKAARYFSAVDSHTEGMPTRVITGGVGTIPGATMNDKRLHFIEHDHRLVAKQDANAFEDLKIARVEEHIGRRGRLPFRQQHKRIRVISVLE